MGKTIQCGRTHFTGNAEVFDYHIRLLGHAPGEAVEFTGEDNDSDDWLGTDVPPSAPSSEYFQVSFAGTLRNLTAKVTSNERDVDTTIYVEINGEDTACYLVIPALETGTFSSSNEVAFVAGDQIQCHIYSPSIFSNDDDDDGLLDSEDTDDDGDGIPDVDDDAETTDLDIVSLLVEMENDGDTQINILCTETITVQMGSTGGLGRFYYPATIDGGRSYWHQLTANRESYAAIETDRATTEPHTQSVLRVGGTISNFQLAYWTNGPNDNDLDITLTLCKNGVATAITVALVSGGFGRLSSDQTVDVVAGDVLGYEVTWPTEDVGVVSALVGVIWAAFEIETADETHGDIFSVRGGAQTPTAYRSGQEMIGGISVDTGEVDEEGNPIYETVNPRPAPRDAYYAFVGNPGGVSTGDGFLEIDENEVSIPLPFCARMSRMRFYVGYFDGEPVTMYSRIDGVTGNQSVVIDGTGLFEDTENYDDVTCHGEFCYMAIADPDALTTDMRIDWIGTTAEPIECDCPDDCEHRCPDDALMFEELVDRTFVMIGEDPDAPVYWTDDEISRHVNDAYISLAKETKALEIVEAEEQTSGEASVSVSDQVGQIFRVAYDDRKIENTTKWELDRTEPDWENQDGYIDGYVSTLEDNRTIRTFKAWTGDANGSQGLFFDGAYEYTAWETGLNILTGTRVTNVVGGVTYGFIAIADHTAGIGNEPGVGTGQAMVWKPLALQVWATQNPPDLGLAIYCTDEPLFPPWFHLTIAYRAASTALRKYGEQGNAALADAYAEIVADYMMLMRGYVANRTPERLTAMGGRWSENRRRPQPFDRVIEEA